MKHVCEHCSCEFDRWRNRPARFCSHKCSNEASKVMTCPCSRPAIGTKDGSPICAFCSKVETQLEMFAMLDAITDKCRTEEESRQRAARYEEDRWAASRPKPEPIEKPAHAFCLIQGFGNYALATA